MQVCGWSGGAVFEGEGSWVEGDGIRVVGLGGCGRSGRTSC